MSFANISVDVDSFISDDEAANYRNVNAISNEIKETELFPLRNTKVGLLVAINGGFKEVHSILEKAGINHETDCIILTDRIPKEKINKNNKSNTKKYKRWAAVEVEYFGSKIRVATCSVVNRSGIFIDNEWKWFRSFALVSVMAKRQSLKLV